MKTFLIIMATAVVVTSVFILFAFFPMIPQILAVAGSILFISTVLSWPLWDPSALGMGKGKRK